MKESETQKGNIVSPLCVLAAGLLWGCMGLLVRSMTPYGFTSMEIVTFRAVVTGILMLIYMLVRTVLGKGGGFSVLRVRIKDLWCFIGTGIASVTFFNFCYFSCMGHTTLQVAAVLLYTAPAFLLVMSFVLFKEKFTVLKILCLILTFAGCVLVSGAGSTENAGGLGFTGLMLGLGAGFGYALYSVFSWFAIEKGYSSFTITTYTFLFAILGCAPFVDWRHFAGCIAGAPERTPVFVILTFATTVMAYILYTRGLSGMETGMAGIIASIEPVMASVVGIVLYHEPVTLTGVLGMVLVLAGCVIVGLRG